MGVITFLSGVLALLITGRGPAFAFALHATFDRSSKEPPKEWVWEPKPDGHAILEGGH